MAIAAFTHPVTEHAQPHPPRRRRPRWLLIAGWVALAGLMIGIWFAGQNWPFRYRKMKPLLEDVFGSQIAITGYHRTYFPNPGFVATGLMLRRKSAPDQPPIGTVQTFFVQGRWIDLLLLRSRLQLVEITGLHMVLPPPGSKAAQEDFPAGSTSDFSGPETPITRLEIHNAVLDVLRDNGSRFTFPVEQLHIEDMQKGKAMRYVVAMDNAIPYGHIQASGSFGPLNAHDPGKTLVSGRFVFDRIKLHDVGKISGTMRASGSFDGLLESIHATTETLTPDFAVSGGRPTQVAGSIDCTVNGLSGDVVYHSMIARTGATTVDVSGSTAGAGGKTTNLELRVTDGRAEDLMRPFMHRPAPILGPVTLHAHATLAPSRKGDFFHRLHVTGAFDVPAEHVTNDKARRGLAAFSTRAQGGKADSHNEPPDADAISSLAGPTVIEDAVVHTKGLTFNVAGASATLEGTYNLHTDAVHLTGTVATKADLAHDAGGFKSFLLKPLAPFFRKKNAGAVVPIALTGTPGKYKVTENLGHHK